MTTRTTWGSRKKFLSFSVQPGADFGHHFNLCPTLFLSEALNLPFQILFLVSGGH